MSVSPISLYHFETGDEKRERFRTTHREEKKLLFPPVSCPASFFYHECALACILTIYSTGHSLRCESFPLLVNPLLVMVSCSFCNECKEEVRLLRGKRFSISHTLSSFILLFFHTASAILPPPPPSPSPPPSIHTTSPLLSYFSPSFLQRVLLHLLLLLTAPSTADLRRQ